MEVGKKEEGKEVADVSDVYFESKCLVTEKCVNASSRARHDVSRILILPAPTDRCEQRDQRYSNRKTTGTLSEDQSFGTAHNIKYDTFEPVST